MVYIKSLYLHVLSNTQMKAEFSQLKVATVMHIILPQICCICFFFHTMETEEKNLLIISKAR